MKASLLVIGTSLLLLALLTAALSALQNVADVGTVTIIYLIAVLFAAIRGGVVPAVITAVVAIGAAAFFFYPPIYDFRVYNPIHLIDLVLFIVVAVVTGQLATGVRRAKMREQGDLLREALIGSVSHELRTPLSAIVGSASVLAKSPDIANNAQLAPLVKGLREEAERLQRIHSESARCHAHQQRRCSSTCRMGRSGRHRQRGNRAQRTSARPTSAQSRVGERPSARSARSHAD